MTVRELTVCATKLEAMVALLDFLAALKHDPNRSLDVLRLCVRSTDDAIDT